MSEARIRALADLRAADAATLGGKAAGLGEARAAGERVPDAFVLTPAAFEAVLTASGLAREHAEAVARARRDDLTAAAAVADKLLDARWPETLTSAVKAAAKDLRARRLAVRSSATLEDGEASAAAGVYESCLDVAPEDLGAAINRCWAASLRDPALVHALSLGQDPGHCRISLLVQAFVEPLAAGVLFSLDPTDEARETMRLATVAGRGEALVQGDAGEDFVVPRAGRLPDGLRVAFPWLPELRALALRLEKRFGRAVDLEFAWDGCLHLLQVRPIAHMPPGSERRKPIHWSRDLAEERFPDPITPMGWSVLQGAFRTNLEILDRRFGLRARRPDEVATVIGGYVYNNRDFFAVPGSLRFRPAAHLPFLGAYVKQGLRLLAPSSLANLGWLRRPRRGAVAADVRDPRLLAVAGLFEAFVFAHANEVADAWANDFETLIANLDALKDEDFAALDDDAMQAFIDRRMAALDAYMEPDLAIYLVKSACRWLVEELGEVATGARDAELVPRLTGGLAANATLEMNAALDALHAAVAADSYLAAALRLGDTAAVPTAWVKSSARPARDAFLAAYGHVTLSWDVRQPPLVESPELLDGLLAQRLRVPSPGQAEQQRQALATRREAEVERLAAQLAPAPWAPGFFRRLVETLHTFMRLDEEHHLFCSRALPTDRRLLKDLSRRLIERGVLAEHDQVFFLTLDEVRAILREPSPFSRQRLVARRRAAFERAFAGRPVEAYVGDRPVALERVIPAAGSLTGQGASPGVVEGRVRVVATAADMASFQPGEVLVVPTPKPSFTPLFAVAAGLVSARGSSLSHGLISAREYGLPAVTEVPGALEALRTGQRVRIDGATGTIAILS